MAPTRSPHARRSRWAAAPYEIFRLDALQTRYDVERLPVHAARPARERPPPRGRRARSRATTSRPSPTWVAGRRAEPRDLLHARARPAPGLHRRARRSSTSPRCATRCATSAATPRASTRCCPPSSSSTTRCRSTSSATPRRLRRNAELEFERNRERYAFLRWGQQAFDNFKVVPPEHRHRPPGQPRVPRAASSRRARSTARVQAFPDTLVGTDSHTTMINGLGVLGWGVGGIEAEAAMLGEADLDARPAGRRLPAHRPAARGRDRDRPRAHRDADPAREPASSGSSSSSSAAGSPACRSPTARRSANMAPGVRRDVRLLPGRRRDAALPAPDRPRARSASSSSRRTARSRASSTTRDARADLLDRSSSSTSATSSRASPARAGRRTACRSATRSSRSSQRSRPSASTTATGTTSSRGDFPASDPTASQRPARRGGAPERGRRRAGRRGDAERAAPVRSSSTASASTLEHGAVVIAAITSCTNTSNPAVMVGGRPAREEGGRARPEPQAVGEDEPRARLEGRHRVLRRSAGLTPVPRAARLQHRRLRLHDLHRQLRPAARGDLDARSTRATSSSARCSPATATSRRASTRRCGRTTSPRRRSSSPTRSPGGWTSTSTTEPLGHGTRRRRRLPARHLADAQDEVARDDRARPCTARDVHAHVRRRLHGRRELARAAGSRRATCFAWDADSTYVRQPPYFDGMTPRAGARSRTSRGARCLVDGRRLGHDRPHLAGRLDQARQPGGPLPDRARRRAHATSTRTARGAATTR